MVTNECVAGMYGLGVNFVAEGCRLCIVTDVTDVRSDIISLQ